MGYVADGFTKAAIPDAFVTLMRTDSTVVDTIKVQKQQSYTFGVGRGAASTRYYFKMSRTPADYIIKVEHPNYETSFTPYTIKKYSRRTYYTNVPTIYLKKAAHAHHYETATNICATASTICLTNRTATTNAHRQWTKLWGSA